MRYRIFAAKDTSVEPIKFLEHLHDQGLEVTANFRGDHLGWFQADLFAADEEEPIKLERFLATEEGIRIELNTWAAWIETVTVYPLQDQLLRHLIGTRQVFTILQPPDEALAETCLKICHYLARETDGIYQVDGRGFFTLAGELLVKE